MKRERALKVVLVLVGLFFLAGFYFLTTSLWHARWHAEQSETEPMFLASISHSGFSCCWQHATPRRIAA